MHLCVPPHDRRCIADLCSVALYAPLQFPPFFSHYTYTLPHINFISPTPPEPAASKRVALTLEMSLSDPEKEKDVHVINRDSAEYSNPDTLDTPSFIHSLDFPSPNANEPPDPDYWSAEPSSKPMDHVGMPHNRPEDFQMPSNFNAHSEFPIKEDYSDPAVKSEDEFNGTLTKHMAAQLPPLPQLSEPVIPNSNANFTDTSFSDYLLSLTNGRHQPLITSGKKKKESQGPKTRPAFVMKIWSMVNDPANHDYIRWNDDGETFQVVHREDFMKNILPKYFKHNNFASFVRQLNMYGWHKIQDVNSGSMKDDRSPDEILQFKNPFFIRGREDLLDNIVRNKTGSSEDIPDPNHLNYHLVMSELDLIKMNQLAILEDMRRMRKDNQLLWTETLTARERYQTQTQTLEKIMKFLAAVYGNSAAGKIFEVEDSGYNNNQVSTFTGALPLSNYSQPPAGLQKPRLMLMDQAHQPKANSAGASPSNLSTGQESIEEIVRNSSDLKTSDPNSSAARMYQQFMNTEDISDAASPSHFFPELNNAFDQHDSQTKTPNADPLGKSGNRLQGLEQNIYKQGQALLQVQDWIHTLANKQEQQQQQLQQQQMNILDSPHDLHRLDDFDVNEFLNNNSGHTPNQNPERDTPESSGLFNSNKRVLTEIDDDMSLRKRSKN